MAYNTTLRNNLLEPFIKTIEKNNKVFELTCKDLGARFCLQALLEAVQ